LISQTGRKLCCKYYNTFLPRLIARVEMMMCIIVFHYNRKSKTYFRVIKRIVRNQTNAFKLSL